MAVVRSCPSLWRQLSLMVPSPKTVKKRAREEAKQVYYRTLSLEVKDQVLFETRVTTISLQESFILVFFLSLLTCLNCSSSSWIMFWSLKKLPWKFLAMLVCPSKSLVSVWRDSLREAMSELKLRLNDMTVCCFERPVLNEVLQQLLELN